MARKNVLVQYPIIVAGDMSTASITSAVTSIQFLDTIGIQADFTTGGTPVGLLAVQVSADYAQDNNGNVTNAGTWSTLTSVNASGGSPVYFDIILTSAPYIRLLYTMMSGTGTLNAIITAKEIG